MKREVALGVLVFVLIILIVVTLFVQPGRSTGCSQVVVTHSPKVRMQLPAVVPKQIWQTWHSHTMPAGMRAAVAEVQRRHPDFKHTVMDDAQCLQFLKRNFPPEVSAAWECLIPGAYQADLWRLCVLYKVGGIYLDIKFVPVPPTTFYSMIEKCHFVEDRPQKGFPGIYNGFMVCAPGDPRIKACIDNLLLNVQNQYYGATALEPTGPGLVAKWIHADDPDVDLKYVHNSLTQNKHIINKHSKQKLVKNYKTYLKEQKNTQKTPHYSTMWEKRQIYKIKNSTK